MNGEVTFRRAVVGGFNRDDVMSYISEMASDNNEYQKLRVSLRETEATVEKLRAELDAKNKELEAAKQNTDGEQESYRVALKEAEAKVEKLTAELEAKNQEIAELKGSSGELDELKQKLQQYESKNSEFDETAEKLMRDSMTYADRYVESANLMAGKVRRETLTKVRDADSKIEAMLEKAEIFSKETEDFESMLKFFRAQLSDIEKTFE
ncbi:MAG: hypothetical protein IJZ88_06475 [Clostridia bacterium]|nr:hypothetical protein [Clostridia bacterium]